MAVKVTNKMTDSFELIIRSDSAIDVTDEEYAEYLKDLDESKLKFVENDMPTRWVMRKSLDYKNAMRIKTMRQKESRDGNHYEVQLGYSLEETRLMLIDIKNPDTLPRDQWIEFKRGSDGFASEELMARLDAAGVADQLFMARALYLAKLKSADKKK